jgi:rod shape-determining protein MreC
MLEFVRRNRILLTSGFLLVFSLLLFSTSFRSEPYRDPISSILLEGLAPFQVAFAWLRRSAGGVWGVYFNLVDTEHENLALRERIDVLQGDLVRLTELELANQRLRDLLQFRASLEGDVLGARVIARDPTPWVRTCTIDRGERDGVRAGMAVLSPRGVVGQVTQVSRTASRVLLLTDHNSGIDAFVQRSRARGIVQGTPDEGCQMKYLRRDEDVVPGDRVLTSGLDGIFPKGILIGEVVEVARRHRDLLQVAVVRPSVDLDRIEEVLVTDFTLRVEEAEATD